MLHEPLCHTRVYFSVAVDEPCVNGVESRGQQMKRQTICLMTETPTDLHILNLKNETSPVCLVWC